ncbi:MAG: hypothetical protein RLZZ127_3011, partial [Planctomycetota bacterium]
GSQILPTVGLFVGGGLSVRVVTARTAVEQLLAPYPGVRVEVLPAYDQAPAEPVRPPVVLALDRADDLHRVLAWLPETTARFHAGSRPVRGLLPLTAGPQAERERLRTRWETLARVDRLVAMARQARRAVVLMYADPDPDAIGAGLALAQILRLGGAEVAVRYTGEVRRYQNKLLLKYLGRRVARLREGELAEADLVAVVDAQPGFWRQDPPRADIVIDHHPARDDTRAAYTDLRPTYGSTSTILAEYLQAAGLRIPRPVATALLYGLTTDTDDLRRHAGQADIRIYDLLHGMVDRPFLDRLQKAQIPPRLLDAIAWGISHRVVYRDLMLIHFGEVGTPDTLVQVADLVLLTCGINVAVCAGIAGSGEARRLVVVFRGDGYHMDVGRRARDAFADIGSAGGHKTMGRAEVPIGAMSPAESATLLVDTLFRRMAPERRRRLVQTLVAHLASPRPPDPDTYELEG